MIQRISVFTEDGPTVSVSMGITALGVHSITLRVTKEEGDFIDLDLTNTEAIAIANALTGGQ